MRIHPHQPEENQKKTVLHETTLYQRSSHYC
jgi:hypothetical protein